MSVIDFVPQATLGTELLPKRYDLEVYRGDSPSFTFVFNDGTEALNLSGATARCEIKTVIGGTEGTAVLTVSPDLANAATGKVVIPFSVSDTNTLATSAAPTIVDGLIWELEIVLGGVTRTFVGGKIKVYEDIVENP